MAFVVIILSEQNVSATPSSTHAIVRPSRCLVSVDHPPSSIPTWLLTCTCVDTKRNCSQTCFCLIRRRMFQACLTVIRLWPSWRSVGTTSWETYESRGCHDPPPIMAGHSCGHSKTVASSCRCSRVYIHPPDSPSSQLVPILHCLSCWPPPPSALL